MFKKELGWKYCGVGGKGVGAVVHTFFAKWLVDARLDVVGECTHI